MDRVAPWLHNFLICLDHKIGSSITNSLYAIVREMTEKGKLDGRGQGFHKRDSAMGNVRC